MSDNDRPELNIPHPVAAALAPEILAQMQRSCELARQNQLNKNQRDPRLKALEEQWKTMDKFSKRELGDAPQPVRPQLPQVSAQLAPGQKVEVTGPATIYGGQIQTEVPPGDVKK